MKKCTLYLKVKLCKSKLNIFPFPTFFILIFYSNPSMTKTVRSGFAFGKNKGHINTPLKNLELVNTYRKKSFKLSESSIFAREVAKEICGLAPYETKAIEFLKKNSDKRCKKFLKKRLGNLKRTNKKLEELMGLVN